MDAKKPFSALMKPQQNRLAVLVFTDVVGFSSMAELNEVLAKELIFEHRKIVRQLLTEFWGKEHDTAGDGFFIEFSSAENAFHFGLRLQHLMQDRNRSLPTHRQVTVRIGIHLGDVLALEDGITGHNVNIAARIQSLAPAGGMCFTRAVYDQVREKFPKIKIQKMGTRVLKNISAEVELFSILIAEPKAAASQRPWHFFKSLNYSQGTLGLTYFMAFLIFCIFSAKLVLGNSDKDPADAANSRVPASMVKDIDLQEGWTISKSGESSIAYNPDESWRFSDRYFGSYELVKSFDYSSGFSVPTLVLGLLAGHSRIYLNDFLIGASDHLNDLSTFVIEKSLFKEKNILRIQFDSPPSMNIGLTRIPSVGIRIGEFSEVREAVLKNQNRHQILQSVFLIASTLVWLVSFLAFSWGQNLKSHRYASLYLLAGTLYLGYYSPWAPEIASYQYLRFIKMISLYLGAFSLCGGYYKEKSKIKFVQFLNFLMLGVFVGSGLDLLYFEKSIGDYVVHSNFYFVALLIGSLSWSGFELARVIFGMLRSPPSTGDSVKSLLRRTFNFKSIYLSFSFLSALAIFNSISSGSELQPMSSELRDRLLSFTIVTPFLFALFTISVLMTNAYRNRNLIYRRKQRDLILSKIQTEITKNHADKSLILSVQSHLCECISATRSSLFTFANNSPKSSFQLISKIPHIESSTEIGDEQNANHEILEYVQQFQTPLLIEDLQKDPRFQKGYRNIGDFSCMVFPLIVGGKNIGALSFADKSDGQHFSPEDFALVSEVQLVIASLMRPFCDASSDLAS